MTARRPDPEPLLLGAVRACILLVLLAPLVTAPWTLYPYSVGKALWVRVIVAAMFALWAALALLRPRWRPPGGALLWLLAAGLAVSALSAAYGVGPQRSWWSTYVRMQGIANAAHWAAFATVVASVTRTPEDWARLLNANLAVGLAASVFAIVRHLAPEAPLPFPSLEGHWPRIGASAGNPIFLGAYLQAVALLAAGFLVRTCCAGPGDGLAMRLFWAAALGCALAALSLTGSLGALAGLAAGLGTACLLYALFGRARRARRLGLAGLGAIAAVAFALALAAVPRGAEPPPDPGARPAFGGGNVMVERATSAAWVGFTLGNRLRSWEAGAKAFAERPLLGWGPGGYFVASARHLSAPRGRAKVQDHAHNLALEEAVGKGAAGLAAWLALWGATALAAVRAARRLENPRERALAAFAAAALAGWLVQAQTSFYTAESWLQHMLLLAFLARLDAGLRPERGAARLPSLLRAASMRIGPGLRALAGAAAVALAAASVASSVAIHSGARAMWRADSGGPFVAEIGRAVAAFGPLANGPRIVLFNNLALNWEVLARHHADEAARLLALAEKEAEAALAAEPESWVLHHALARLWLKVAATEPEYAARAERHLARSRVLAPNLDPMEAPIPPAAAR